MPAQNWQQQLISWLIGPGLQTAIVIALAIGIRVAAVRIIHRIVARAAKRAQTPRIAPVLGRSVDETAARVARERTQQRAHAIGTLLTSTVTVIIAITTIVTILPILGIAVTPLLASAGVIGVTLGFGAQALIKDYVAGIFLILEDQYGVGDVVDVGPVTATVDFVALRYTRLRDADGVIWYVRNGEIVRVANRSQGWATVDVTIEVAASTDIPMLRRAIDEVSRQMSERGAEDGLLTAPSYAGTEPAAGGWMLARIHAAVAPDRHDDAVRAIITQARETFTAAGISVHPRSPEQAG